MTAVLTRENNGWLSRLGSLDRAPAQTGTRDVHDIVMEAVYALALGEPATAKRTSYRAAALDDGGTYSGFTGAVERGVADLESTGTVQTGTWDRLTAIVANGPLGSIVERIRTA